MARIDEEERVLHNVHTLGGNQEMWFLTEDGLYEVLMQSRKPIAKEFKKEVKRILKKIRNFKRNKWRRCQTFFFLFPKKI